MDLHISRHSLDLRELVVLHLLLELTVHRGRTTARIPKREYICALTGVTKGNLTPVLNRLVNAGVITIEDDTCYTVQPSSYWRIPTRVQWTFDREQLLAWLQNLDVQDQPQLLPAPEGLERALAATGLLGEAATKEGPSSPRPVESIPAAARSPGSQRSVSTLQRVPALGVHPSGCPGSACPVAKAAPQTTKAVALVPESGTNPFPNREPIRSRIGNQSVPESGTPARASEETLNVQRVTAPEKEQLNAERLTGAVAQPSRLCRPADVPSATPKRPRVPFEDELLAEIRDLVGADDMSAWGGDWRVNWVRAFPADTVRRAVADVRCQIREGAQPTLTVGAWIKDTIRRFA